MLQVLRSEIGCLERVKLLGGHPAVVRLHDVSVFPLPAYPRPLKYPALVTCCDAVRVLPYRALICDCTAVCYWLSLIWLLL